jgi:transposase
MEKRMIGVDISKDKLDYCVIDNQEHKVQDRGGIKNENQAIRKWLESIDLDCTCFAMEHTGHYGSLLTSLLADFNAKFYIISPLELKRSLGIHRGKSDAIDAYRIASYALKNGHKLQPYRLPSEKLRRLKALLAARNRYVKMKTMLINSHKNHKVLSQTLDVEELMNFEQQQIKTLEEKVKSIEKECVKVIKSSDALKENYQKITEVIGIGPVVAATWIVETSNFKDFTSGRRFSCYSGLAPFPYSSGSSINKRSKTHHFRHKRLKALLLKSANTAIQHDPQLKTYYNRKLKEGKHKLSVLNAVANKLVLRVFARQKREESFVKMAM